MSDVPPLSVFLRPELPDVSLLGLAGEVTRELAAITDADPAALLLTYLTLLGNAIGPEPHLMFGGAQQSARLFTVLVGDAAQGRKGTALNMVRPLFADPGWMERWESGLQSPEAMIERVADGEDPRLMIIEPEFARLVRTVINSGGKLSAQLRAAYDGTTLQVTRRGAGRSLESRTHHISLLGHITPGELAKLQSQLQAAGGLERRILFGFVTRTREISPHEAAKIPASLAERTAAVVAWSQAMPLESADPITRELCERRGVLPATRFPMSGPVVEGWQEIRGRLPETDSDLGDMFNGAETHVYRLALTYALAERASHVTADHIDAALGLWEYCARSAEVIFGVPAGLNGPDVNPRLTRKVVTALHGAYPAGLTKTQITHKALGGNHGGADLIMERLTAAGLVEQYAVQTGGRPATGFRLVAPASVVPSYPTPREDDAA